MSNLKKVINDVFYEVQAEPHHLTLIKNSEIFESNSFLHKIAQKEIVGKNALRNILIMLTVISFSGSVFSLLLLTSALIDREFVLFSLWFSALSFGVFAIIRFLDRGIAKILRHSFSSRINFKNFESHLEEIEGFSESFIKIVKELDNEEFVQFFTDLEQLSKDSAKIKELEQILSFQEKTYNNDFRLDTEKKLQALLSTKEAILSKHDQIVHKAIEKSIENKTLTLVSE